MRLPGRSPFQENKFQNENFRVSLTIHHFCKLEYSGSKTGENH